MRPFSFPAIGVDISDESFKFVRLEAKKGKREVAFFGDKELPKGVVEAGEIKDSALLAKALHEALSPYRHRAPYLILALPEEKGFLRLVKMQKIPTSEIRQALEFQLEEHIPYPPEDLIFDYQVLSQTQKAELNVVVTAYPKGLVHSYLAAANASGFIPVVFELESQAVARAVVPRGIGEAVLVGDIGKTRTTFSIVWKGAIHFTSTVKMGGRDIDSILMNSLHVSEKDASEIKIGRGLDVNYSEIIKSLSPALVVLKEEAERQITFWDHRREQGEPVISRVYLCGGDAHLRGLPEFLAAELRLATQRAEVWKNIFHFTEYVPPISAHDSLFYATALGLALRGDADLFASHELAA